MLPSPRTLRSRIETYEMHALEYGTGEEIILLLHGLSGSSRWWVRNIPELATRYRVLVPDLIGFGRSRLTGRLPTITEVARLLVEWLGDLDVDRVNLIGHSMGGQISIHVAARTPERLERMILVDPAGIPRPLSPRMLLRFAADVGPLWRWGDPSFLPVIAGDAWSAGPRVLLRAIREIRRDDVRPLLRRIEVPTLIVWGERDTLVPLADAWEFRREIRDSKLVVLRAAGHNPMVDRPAAFNRIVQRFLDGETVGR